MYTYLLFFHEISFNSIYLYREEYCPGLVNNPGMDGVVGVVDLTKESSCHSE